MLNKLLVICGPTATGKSDLAVRLAKIFDGEVVSADSRQVYKGLDIGTGKITHKEMEGIPHYLLDVASPMDRFTVMDWKKQAKTVVDDIHARNKLPIICGGTGFYIKSLVDDIKLPNIEVDEREREKLEEKTLEELYKELKQLDSVFAAKIDSKNKRRLFNAVVLARRFGKVPQINNNPEKYEALQIGIIFPDAKLKERINKRLISRINAGMIEEAVRVHKEGLSFERMDELGLEYRYLAKFLQKIISKEQLIDSLATKIWQYARRQKTWFKKDKRIHWFDVSEKNYREKIEKLVEKWYATN